MVACCRRVASARRGEAGRADAPRRHRRPAENPNGARCKRWSRLDHCRSSGGLREVDGGSRLVREPETPARLGDARPRRQRSGPLLEVRRNGGRSAARRSRAPRAAAPRRCRGRDRESLDELMNGNTAYGDDLAIVSTISMQVRDGAQVVALAETEADEVLVLPSVGCLHTAWLKPRWGLRPVGSPDRGEALPVAQHHPLPHTRDLSEARRGARGPRPSLVPRRWASRWSDRNHPCDRRLSCAGALGARHSQEMPSREYRLTVDGELSESVGGAFAGMTLTRDEGTHGALPVLSAMKPSSRASCSASPTSGSRCSARRWSTIAPRVANSEWRLRFRTTASVGPITDEIARLLESAAKSLDVVNPYVTDRGMIRRNPTCLHSPG